MGEVAGLSQRSEIQIREVVSETVGPLDFEDGVALAPPDAGWRLDLRQGGWAVADEVYPGLVGGDVPVEPALQVARLHEVVHPEMEILVEEAGLVRPVIEEMAKVSLTGLPVLTHQGGGPGLLVEGLVPDLVHAVRIHPSPADPGIGTVEEEQARETFRIFPGKTLRHVRAHVMADYPEPLEIQSVGKGAKILHQVAQKFLRRTSRLVRVAEAPEVWRDYVKAFGQDGNVLMPAVPELGPPVQQHQRISIAVANVVKRNAVGFDMAMVPLAPVHPTYYPILLAESRALILQVLEDAGGTHAAADAHGDEAVLRAAALHLVDQLYRELGACGAHGMAERDGPTVDVRLVEVHTHFTYHGQSLGRERLVELDEVDVVHREPGLLQHLRDGHRRSDAHDLGPDATNGEPDEAGERREPALLGLLPVHNDDRGGP